MNKFVKLTLWTAIAVLGSSATFMPSVADATSSPLQGKMGKQFAPGEILIRIKKDATPEQLDALARLQKNLNVKVEKKANSDGYIRLKFDREREFGREDEIAKEFEATGAVDYAAANSVVPMLATPNDPLFTPSLQYQFTAIKAQAGWDIKNSATNILTAVCDAGFDVNHPDLKANLVLPAYNVVTDNNVLVRAGDMHGTSVIGAMAAVSNNGLGVAGVMWSAKVLPIQVSNLASGDATRADLAECIRYAADRGAKVVNVSYGGMWDVPNGGTDYPVIESAAAYLASKGGLVVAAAGNDGANTGTAANSPHILLVGATDANNVIADFSVRGAAVDVLAPGNNMYIPVATYSWESWGGQVDDYGLKSGTSFASPLVAGLAGLIYSLRPERNGTQVQNLIKFNSTDLGTPGFDSLNSYGLINVNAALWVAKDVTAPVLSVTSPTSGSTVSNVFNVNGTATDNLKVTKIEVRIDGVLVGTASACPFSVPVDSGKFANGAHRLTVRAFDAAGNPSNEVGFDLNFSNTLSIVLDNLAPGASDATRSFKGSWCTSGITGHYGLASLYSCSTSAVDSYRLTPNIVRPGAYRVYLRYTANANRSTAVPVTISHSYGVTTNPVNMQVNGNTFVLLGTYFLAAGQQSYVEISSSAGQANIDAVRFDAVR